MGIFRLYEDYRDNLAQRDAFLKWIQDTGSLGDTVAVRFPGIIEDYEICADARGGLYPKRADVSRPRYILCSPESVEEIEFEEGSRWRRFFSTASVEVWEDTSMFSADSTLVPLHHGLHAEEQEYLLNFVRSIAESHLQGGQDFFGIHTQSTNTPTRLSSPSFAAVSVWWRGVLRGCMLAFENSCVESVQTACLRALKDPRFRPIKREELADVRFEVVLFSGLVMPLTRRERREGVLYPEKSYRMSNGECAAWFLPEVLNMGKISGFEEYLTRLSRKGGLSLDTAHVHYFEVEDFIEDEQGVPLSLSGPVPAGVLLDEQHSKALYERAERHLTRLLADSPLFPNGIDPFDTRSLWRVAQGRGLFTMQALTEYAEATKGELTIEMAIRSYRAYKGMLDTEHSDQGQILAAAYLGMAALDLGYKDDACRYADVLKQHMSAPHAFLQPIVCLQASRFLWRYGDSASAEQLLTLTWNRFQSARNLGRPISLAEYADLLVLVPALWGSAAHEYDEISSWYLTQQHEDGSFPNLTTGGLAYTRGTAKIFESLAFDPERHAAALRSVLGWLARMQYTEGSMFFIPTERRELFEGSFRHDVCNPEAWPDAAGHVLVGATRLRDRTLFL